MVIVQQDVRKNEAHIIKVGLPSDEVVHNFLQHATWVENNGAGVQRHKENLTCYNTP
jgi:hypothetical protein